jgi:hypothetical protein
MLSLPTLRHHLAFLAGVVALLAALSFIEGAWAQGSVTIANPADIAKAEGIQQPYQASADCTFVERNCEVLIETPASQRLVIEFVSASCFIPNNDFRLALIGTSVGGNTVLHFLSAQSRKSASGFPAVGHELNISQLVRIYNDPQAGIFLRILAWNPVTDFSNCGLSLSGQAVTVP